MLKILEEVCLFLEVECWFWNEKREEFGNKFDKVLVLVLE